jgi:membrane associated rhomboid family serine protease
VLPSNALIPISDENPTRNFAYLTVAIIALNVAIFFLFEPNFGQESNCFQTDLACHVRNCRVERFFYRWGLVPDEITHGTQLEGDVCPGVSLEHKAVVASIFTSMFMHGGFLHLGGNMLFLWIFGNNIEDRLGRTRYLIFYLLTGVLAALAHAFTHPGSQIPTIGASGAISGVLGAYLVLFPRARVDTILPVPLLWLIVGRIRLPAYAVLGIWFFSQFFVGQGEQAGGGVAWVAHVGGFVAGVILIVLFGGLRKPVPPPELGRWPV